MSPTDLLTERISDIALSRNFNTRLSAAFTVLSLALPALMRAAAAGNVQCREALKEIAPHLAILCPPKT